MAVGVCVQYQQHIGVWETSAHSENNSTHRGRLGRHGERLAPSGRVHPDDKTAGDLERPCLGRRPYKYVLLCYGSEEAELVTIYGPKVLRGAIFS